MHGICSLTESKTYHTKQLLLLFKIHPGFVSCGQIFGFFVLQASKMKIKRTNMSDHNTILENCYCLQILNVARLSLAAWLFVIDRSPFILLDVVPSNATGSDNGVHLALSTSNLRMLVIIISVRVVVDQTGVAVHR